MEVMDKDREMFIGKKNQKKENYTRKANRPHKLDNCFGIQETPLSENENYQIAEYIIMAFFANCTMKMWSCIMREVKRAASHLNREKQTRESPWENTPVGGSRPECFREQRFANLKIIDEMF